MNRHIHAVLLGTAVGDSLGLPAENLPPWRIKKRWPGPWSQRFVFGRGMVSDDTEHTVFVAQCLAEARDAQSFQKKLAWKLRWWLLCVPAGIGFATLRAILKLWMGFPSSYRGVYSAGNGPSMRSALIGAYFAGIWVCRRLVPRTHSGNSVPTLQNRTVPSTSQFGCSTRRRCDF